MPSLKIIFIVFLFYLKILKISGFMVLVKIDWTGKEECRKGQNNRFELELNKWDRNTNKVVKQTKWTNNYDLVLFHEGKEEALLSEKWKIKEDNVYHLFVSFNVPEIEGEKVFNFKYL
uniref:Uncharacterized protein n=1 Tax=Meloidogyne enterolobii TaxID=390850 RepID=A0A6V7UTX3_MELEN|nr:unnamed protein product [Meloidogyne enterolobii]